MCSLFRPSSTYSRYADYLAGDTKPTIYRRNPLITDEDFSHTAKTSSAKLLDSNPIPIKIILNSPVKEVRRSGELIEGFIEVSGQLSGVKGLVVRGYWSSTTHFISSGQVVKEEYHRGFFSEAAEHTEIWKLEEVEQDATPSLHEEEGEFNDQDNDSECTIVEIENSTNKLIPFSFTLPIKTRSTLSNPIIQRFPLRGNLRSFDRTPPPSIVSKAGCVEYIIEAICTFGKEEEEEEVQLLPLYPFKSTPEFPNFDQVDDNSDGLDNYGFIQSSSTLAVERIIFPFVPHDIDVQDLYSNCSLTPSTIIATLVAKRNGIPIEEQEEEIISPGDENSILAKSFKVPSFGRDPRDESLGGSRMTSKRVVKGTLIAIEGGRKKFSSYENRISIKGFGNLKKIGYLRSQVSVPFPIMIARHSLTIPILLYFSYNSKKISTKLKSIDIDRVVFTLNRRTATRGGNERRPQLLVEEIRKQEIRLDLKLIAGEEGKEIKLEMNLQNGIGGSPLKNECLSFRTPNIELEYVMSMIVYLSKPNGGISFYALRSPLQVIAGDFDDTPHYEA